METFDVWLQSQGEAAHFRLKGKRHAEWLRKKLSSEGLTTTPAVSLVGSSSYTFRARYTTHWPHTRIQELLGTMPEVVLHQDSA